MILQAPSRVRRPGFQLPHIVEIWVPMRQAEERVQPRTDTELNVFP